MIYLLNIFLAVLISFLSLSFAPHFRIFGTVPLVMVFFLIALAYFRKGFEPLAIAAFVGFFFDLFSPQPFGFYLLFFLLLVGVIRFLFQEGMKQFSFWYFLMLSLISVLIYYLAQYSILYVEGVRFETINFWPLMLGILVNIGFAIILYAPLERFFDWQKGLEYKLKRR